MGIAETRFDVAVVGGGIIGCLAARRLAALGAEVALLEAGPDPSDPREIDGLLRRRGRQPIQSQGDFYSERSAPFLVDDLDEPYSTAEGAPFLWHRGRQLGGLLHVWDGCSPRISPAQFAAGGDDAPGWPIEYGLLARYYAQAEAALFVRTVAPSALERRLIDKAARHWPDVTMIPRPIAHLRFPELRQSLRAQQRLTVILGANVDQLLLDGPGRRVDAVRYIDAASGEPRHVSARAVMLTASTLESTRILLNSISRNFPLGLGNSSGVLGCFLREHSCGIGVTGKLAATAQPSQGIYVLGTEFGVEAQLPSQSDRARFWAFAAAEVAPVPANRVILDRASPDRWGRPTLRIEFRYSRADFARMDRALGFIEVLLSQVDGVICRRRQGLQPPGSSVHAVGTARMGADPGTSFLNRFNQSWEVPNVFVADGAAFPSSPCPNPTLTAVALALRCCDTLTMQLHGGGPLDPLVA